MFFSSVNCLDQPRPSPEPAQNQPRPSPEPAQTQPRTCLAQPSPVNLEAEIALNLVGQSVIWLSHFYSDLIAAHIKPVLAKPGQSRQFQIRPDQARPNQTSPDKPSSNHTGSPIYFEPFQGIGQARPDQAMPYQVRSY